MVCLEEGGIGMEVRTDQIKDTMLEDLIKNNIILTTVSDVLGWARSNSIWPLTSGLACCAIEMMCAAAGRYDLANS